MNTPFPINQVAVIGAGTMGRGIVISLANAGLSVLWLDCNAAALEAGLGMVSQAWAQQVDKQRITQAQAEACLARVQVVDGYPALAEADLVIEAVYENLALKQEIFRALDAHLKPRAILASNTSYLDINAIAAETGRPDKVIVVNLSGRGDKDLAEVIRVLGERGKVQ